jgi:hypothetical protein
MTFTADARPSHIRVDDDEMVAAPETGPAEAPTMTVNAIPAGSALRITLGDDENGRERPIAFPSMMRAHLVLRMVTCYSDFLPLGRWLLGLLCDLGSQQARYTSLEHRGSCESRDDVGGRSN